ncbi:sodium:solute symporter family protein [Granulicella sp. dw_53]|uniref:sodium:solute symporter family protein n=1 Tax=Granulicella sp. dw_53 TaxID=2719792 RepID=UPI001BD2127E|nr:sodium:solute symporter family protein [Granulicella sp. dw_53]
MFDHATIFAVALCLYCISIILGFAFAGKVRSQSEENFLTAGRSIGPLVGGAALAATQISAGTLVGTVGRHYATGLDWIWIWPGVWFGWLVSAVFIGPKLRACGAVTVPDYLSLRFESAFLRVASALVIIFIYIISLTAQYQACGIIFQTVFGLKPIYGMGILLIVTAIYTTVGGLRVSSYIDVIQVAIIVGSLAISVVILLKYAGGLRATGDLLTMLDPKLIRGWYGWGQIISLQVIFALGIASAPNEMARLSSMRDKATVRYAIGVCFIIQALISVGILIVGLVIRSIFPYLLSADQASPLMSVAILPPLAGSIFLVALFSAIMSNVNSILLVSSGSVSHDLYGKFINPFASEKRKLLCNRLSLVFLSLLPAGLALYGFSDVQSTVLAAARLVGCFFFVPVILGLNSRFGSSSGAIASTLGGGMAAIYWETRNSERFASIDGAEIGILTAFGLYILVGNFTPRVSQQTLRRFFGER